jgi:hypothetical protein
MKFIRDADTLIAVLEQGDLKSDLNAEIAKVVSKLHELSDENPKRKFSGSLTLKMKFSAENGMVTISNDITSTLPKIPRRSDIFWTTEDGALSTEHPAQTDMFGGPRVIEGRQQ